MEEKIELTPFQYVAHWWVDRMKSFTQDILNVGHGTKRGVAFAQLFGGLTDKHWRILYLKLTDMIKTEYEKEGKFVQSTKQFDQENKHYIGHLKINEMIKSIINIDVPNAQLDPTNHYAIKTQLSNIDGQPHVFIIVDVPYVTPGIEEPELKVEKNYILTGDESLLEDNFNTKII